jgi:hypothetical protein
MSKNSEIEECVTMAQFNLKKRSKEKQEKLSQDLQEIIGQLRIHQNVHDNRNNQDYKAEKTNEQIVAQLAIEQQLQRLQVVAHVGRPLILGHMNGGSNCGNGRGRGFGDRGSERAESDEEDDPEQHWNDGNQRRGRYAWNHKNEERFGNLKFSIPKFDGGSDPEAYPTWELKVDRIFHMHNYSEEKKMAMVALEFDDYALIWWEQLLSDRENAGQGDVRSWAEMKRYER